MAIKFDGTRIRLWKSKKEESPGIGLRFDKSVSVKEANSIHDAIEALLEFRYGPGKE